MTPAQAIEQGRELLREQEWNAAFSKLTAPEVAPLLGPVDLEGVAKVAYLLGNEAEGSQFYRRAHEEFLKAGQTQAAARCAFWLGFMSLINGELAVATGWLSRADRLLAGEPDCCEKDTYSYPSVTVKFIRVILLRDIQHSKLLERLETGLATKTW